MMNVDNDEVRKKVNYEVILTWRIIREGNCDHDVSIRVKICRQIFII